MKKILILFLLFLSFLLLLSFGIYTLLGNPNMYYLQYSDWQLHLSWAGAARNIILRYGQFPMWNPFRCGGVPIIGQPETDILSPFLPFLILFGPLFGYVALFVTDLILGLFGFYLLAKYYKISTFGSILAAEAYMLSGLFIIPFLTGMTNFLSVGYLPFVVLFFEKYLRSKKFSNAIFSALFLALMFLQGFHYLPIICIYLGCTAIINTIETRSFKAIQSLVLVVFLFSCFSGIKLFRTLEVVHNNDPTYTYETSAGYSLQSLFSSLVSRNQSVVMIHNLQKREPTFFSGASYQIEENGMYIGILLFCLFLYGFFRNPKELRHYYGIFLVFLFLSFGTNMQPSLYKFIHNIPVISEMRVAQRYRYIFMIPVVLWIGYGFDLCIKKLSPKTKDMRYKNIFLILQFIFILALACDFIFVNLNKNNFLPIVYYSKIIQPDKNNKFYNRCTTYNSEYELMMQNQGKINCIDNVLFPSNALCKEDDTYQGRVYFPNEIGTASILKFSPSILEITTNSPEQNLLVVNQNYNKHWHAFINYMPVLITEHENLLALTIPKGKSYVVLFYLPYLVVVGILTSAVSLGLAGYYLIKKQKAP